MISYTLKEMQQQVDTFIQKHGGYWTPLSMLASITEEVGELAREINALEQIKIKKPSEPPQSIGEELADTFFSVICVANYYDIDLAHEFEYVMDKYQKRDRDRFKKK